MRTLSTVPALLILILLFLVPLGCDRDSAALLEARPDGPLVTDGQFPAHSRVFDGRDSLTTRPNGPLATKHNFAIVTVFIADEEGDPIDPETTGSETLLFERDAGTQILAPDGDPVTWGVFSGAEGAIIVKCTRQGTRATVHLSELIPKGDYSVRNKLANPTTGDPIGQVPLGRGGSAGTFQASASGEGHLSGIIPPGALGEGEISACMLDDVADEAYDWHVVGSYQNPSEGGSLVEQAGFGFEVEQEDDEPEID